jgi:glycosyltransferase involved in cell wall biosynthesis
VEPLISLVCTTVGRPDALRRLLTSVAGSERADAIEFVLVDQGSDRSCIEILEYFDLPGLKRSTVSGRGVSAGRNAGTAIATAPIIAFPNDNCWYPPTTIQNVVTLLDARPEWAGISGKQVTADGGASMLRWLDDEVEISRRNFMRTSISSTLFFRRTALP